MKKLNDNGKGILVFLLKVAVGVLLLINPEKLTGVAITIFGILAAIFGVVKVISYFVTPPEDAAKERSLSRGLLALAVGVFFAFRSGWLTATMFAWIPMFYGVGLIFTGISEVEWTVDMLRLKRNGWIPQAISALLALILGAVLILNPFESSKLLWNFAGIALIVSAIPDILVPFIRSKKSAQPTEPDSSLGNSAEA